MVKKPPRDTKIGGIQSTKKTSEIDPTTGIESVSGVKATSGITGIGKAERSGVRRPTRTMTLEEREELFRMIDEEAAKMFGAGGIPAEKRELVQTAVKMAVDSGLLDTGGNDDTPQPGPVEPKKVKKKLV